MFCRDCGTRLSLRFLENEGLIPYCEKCGAFKFPYFPVAVSMTVVNRAVKKLKDEGLISLRKGKISMTSEQYRKAQKVIHHYVNYEDWSS